MISISHACFTCCFCCRCCCFLLWKRKHAHKNSHFLKWVIEPFIGMIKNDRVEYWQGHYIIAYTHKHTQTYQQLNKIHRLQYVLICVDSRRTIKWTQNLWQRIGTTTKKLFIGLKKLLFHLYIEQHFIRGILPIGIIK